MSDLKSSLDREVAAIRPKPSGFDQTMRLVDRRQRSRRIGAGALGLALILAVMVGLWSALGGGTLAPSGRSTRPANEPATTLPLRGGRLLSAVSIGDAVWELTCDRRCSGDARTSAGRLLRIDMSSGRVTHSTPIRAPMGVKAGSSGVWVISFWDSTVTHVDPATGQVIAVIQLQLPTPLVPGDDQFLPSSIAVDESAVWVSTARGQLARIDPVANQVAAMIELPQESTGEVAAGPSGVWVAEGLQGVYQIDPATNEVSAKVPVQDGSNVLSVDQVAVGDGAVIVAGDWAQPTSDVNGNQDYVVTGGTGVYEIAPSQGRPLHRLQGVSGRGLLASSGGLVWIRSSRPGFISGIDPRSGRVEKSVRLGDGEAFVAYSEGAVLVAKADGSTTSVG